MEPHDVLVVDDDDSIRELINLILTDEGYAVRSAKNAHGAFRLIQEQPPALIVLDLTLPDQSGADFITTYRRLPNATAPIVVVSGLPDVVQLGSALGAAGTLAKPFDVDDLLTTVWGCLDPSAGEAGLAHD